MYNLNNNERKNNSIVAAVITKTARGREEEVQGDLERYDNTS
jgi:hypothetical protein